MKSEKKCSGKVVYTSEREANINKNYIKTKSSRSHIPVRSYYCSICKGWHLTSYKTRIKNG